MSYECADCDRSFDTNQGIESHCNAKDHSMYECSICGGERTYKNEHSLDQHKGAIHSFCTKCERWLVDDSAKTQHIQKSDRHSYCHPCEREFPDDHALKQHFRNASAHVHCVCHECDNGFEDEDDLKEHMEEVHHYCHRCKCGFVHGNALKQHRRDSILHKHCYCRKCDIDFDEDAELEEVGS
ncbi:hypothetical protein AX15_003505 [Amanita polypyramis BW_CC]|nr:hypothetical protein AX15_003505 [Amanita polypyramis BW_CC]